MIDILIQAGISDEMADQVWKGMQDIVGEERARNISFIHRRV